MFYVPPCFRLFESPAHHTPLTPSSQRRQNFFIKTLATEQIYIVVSVLFLKKIFLTIRAQAKRSLKDIPQEKFLLEIPSFRKGTLWQNIPPFGKFQANSPPRIRGFPPLNWPNFWILWVPPLNSSNPFKITPPPRSQVLAHV